ncbi:MAG: 3'-5' exonuclease [candidate division KSB1 bacterium]|nr:3'-5' exonuclease [candidate division KSB1 bacterium]
MDSDQQQLRTSFRSDERIIDFINQVYSDEMLHAALTDFDIDWPYECVQPHRKNGQGYIELWLRNLSAVGDNEHEINDYTATREFVETMIYRRIQTGEIDPSRSAVLVRQNKQLEHIARILDELQVPYVHKSSNPIFEHRAIKPLMKFLKLLVFQDVFDLCEFLRSDYVLLDTMDLKTLLDRGLQAGDRLFLNELMQRCEDIPAVRKALQLFSKLSRQTDPLYVVKCILEHYNVTQLFPLQSDLKNINRFVEITTEFMNSSRQVPITLQGFTTWCEDKKDRESLQQVATAEMNAIELMTVHKSKGLEFDSVFLYWELSPRTPSGSLDIHTLYDLDPETLRTRNFFITHNYKGIVETTSRFAPLEDEKIRREAIEELNVLYVAMTRARENLFLGLTFKNKDGFSKPRPKSNEKPKPKPSWDTAAAVVRYFKDAGALQRDESDTKIVGQSGQILPPELPVETEAESVQDTILDNVLDMNHADYRVPDQELRQRIRHVDLKTAFVDHRSAEKGNIIHYYLSFIRQDTDSQRRYAREKTSEYYGSLVPLKELNDQLNRTERFVGAHPRLFQDFDSRVFTECTLYAPDGAELRIDRLMVNTEKKIIRIIDFKTGAVSEVDQLDRYKAAVAALPQVKQNNYRIETEYVMIE